jgi:hypothetical protein
VTVIQNAKFKMQTRWEVEYLSVHWDDTIRADGAVMKPIPRIMLLICIAFVSLACGASSSPPDLRPEISTFLRSNPQFGTAQGTEPMPDWAEGPRQQVRTSAGAYLFYMKGGEVVTVYRNDGSERQEVWRKQ